MEREKKGSRNQKFMTSYKVQKTALLHLWPKMCTSYLVPRTYPITADLDLMRSLLRVPILGCWGTTLDVVTTLLNLCRSCSDACESAKLRPVHSWMLQAHRFLGLPRFLFPSTVPCTMILLSPELLMTWQYHFIFLALTISPQKYY